MSGTLVLFSIFFFIYSLPLTSQIKIVLKHIPAMNYGKFATPYRLCYKLVCVGRSVLLSRLLARWLIVFSLVLTEICRPFSTCHTPRDFKTTTSPGGTLNRFKLNSRKVIPHECRSQYLVKRMNSWHLTDLHDEWKRVTWPVFCIYYGLGLSLRATFVSTNDRPSSIAIILQKNNCVAFCTNRVKVRHGMLVYFAQKNEDLSCVCSI